LKSRRKRKPILGSNKTPHQRRKKIRGWMPAKRRTRNGRRNAASAPRRKSKEKFS